MADGNPMLLRARQRQGIWGALHRSNIGPIVGASLLHIAVAFSLHRLGWGSCLVIFLIFNVVLFILAAISAMTSVTHAVRGASRQHAWDELLLTTLSDREIVNGQLGLAMRPSIQLLWLASPSYVVLFIGMAWGLCISHGFAAGLALTGGIALLLLLAYAIMAALIVGEAVFAFHSALGGRRSLGRLAIVLLLVVCVVAAPPLIVLLPPILLVLPGICWYQHRALCCSLRQRLLEDR